MKTLIILFFFFMAICYFGRADAKSMQEWQICAQKAANPVVERCKNDENGCLEELCGYYQKPMDQCVKAMNSSTPEEVRSYITTYLLHGVIIPACGTPDETK